MPSTAPRFTMVPSYTPQFPPTSTSSSMITGIAPTGSSTPPICAAAEMWQCLPTCAQLPTSACESTMVPSPTYAPTLMNIGGMQVTPLPMKQPSRMLDPPGTMRTPLASVKSLHRIGGLVEKRLPRRRRTDMSTMAPMRNPSRMPFFTQPFTRQPPGDAASGSAARTVPAFSASLNSWNSAEVLVAV